MNPTIGQILAGLVLIAAVVLGLIGRVDPIIATMIAALALARIIP